MNWNNIDLNSEYETSQNMLDGYSFNTLLLEIACNLPDITPETVRRQAIDSIKAKYDTAIEILEANLQNITKEALKYREMA